MKKEVILLLLIISIPISYAKVIDIPGVKEDSEPLRDSNGVKKFIYAGSSIIASVEGSEIKYYHQGRLSNRIITDFSGNKENEFKSLPFGQKIENSGVDYPFTGKEEDESSLYYFGARYYDDNLGRFVSVDPVRENHAYSYVSNNPMNLVDPYGLSEGRPDYDVTFRGKWWMAAAIDERGEDIRFDNEEPERTKGALRDAAIRGMEGALEDFGGLEKTSLTRGNIELQFFFNLDGSERDIELRESIRENDKMIILMRATERNNPRDFEEAIYQAVGVMYGQEPEMGFFDRVGLGGTLGGMKKDLTKIYDAKFGQEEINGPSQSFIFTSAENAEEITGQYYRYAFVSHADTTVIWKPFENLDLGIYSIRDTLEYRDMGNGNRAYPFQPGFDPERHRK